LIVDTSALVAILKREAGSERLLDAIGEEGGCLPAPAEVEFMMVAGGAGKAAQAQERALLAVCRGQGCSRCRLVASMPRSRPGNCSRGWQKSVAEGGMW
jgi:uncharacterized protein with PIN domain